jgi:sulfoacetaldehyde acetyltransferase
MPVPVLPATAWDFPFVSPRNRSGGRVWNRAGRNKWGAEKRNQIDYFDSRFLGTELDNPNFAEVARAMGAQGLTVEHEDQVGDALLAAVASNQPTVINLRLTQALGDPFRRDAFKPPRRLLAKYAAYSARD